jgi:predicted Zn-ribbon and HTH transcriptional regulator
MHWCTHLNHIPLGLNLEAFMGVYLGPIRSRNLCFMYEDYKIKKCVRCRLCSSA